MTRKFRVWDGVRMWYCLEESEDGDHRDYLLLMDGTVWLHSGDGVVSFIGNAIAMFATGHTVKDADGNDRELYDGDIVEWHSYRTCNCLIAWNDQVGAFEMSEIGSDYTMPLTRLNPEIDRIIGNRYEHPELIEGGGEQDVC